MKIRFNKKVMVMVIGVTIIISILVLGGLSMMMQINEKKGGKSSAINIDGCIANDTGIETSSGKVLISYKGFENQHINIETTSGNVTLEFPETAEFLVEAKTSSGKFQSDFPIKTTDKKDIKGQIGTKNNKVSLKTSSEVLG